VSERGKSATAARTDEEDTARAPAPHLPGEGDAASADVESDSGRADETPARERDGADDDEAGEKAGAGHADEEADAAQADAGRGDSEQRDSEQGDSEAGDSEQGDSEAGDSEQDSEPGSGHDGARGDARARRRGEPAARVKAGRGLVWFLGVVAVVAGAVFVLRALRSNDLPPPAPKADLLDAVPTSPMLLATIDLRALRATTLGSTLLSREGAGVLGRVHEICGFEPVDALDEVALVVPSSPEDADFGLVAIGDVNRDAIVACAEKVIGARGGTPVTTNLGSFRAVRDASTASGEIAARPGGPLLVGAGSYLRTMVDTADGALPTVRTDSAHTALRAAIEDAPLARVTIVLSPRQRATIADEVARSGGKAPAALEAVLAAALGAKITSETLQAHAVVLVADPAHAKELDEAIDEVRRQRADDPLLRLLGLGQLLDRVRVSVDGTQVHLRLEMTISEAEIIADKLGALRDTEGAAAGRSSAALPSPLESAPASSDAPGPGDAPSPTAAPTASASSPASGDAGAPRPPKKRRPR
jgi:hypothetical protein